MFTVANMPKNFEFLFILFITINFSSPHPTQLSEAAELDDVTESENPAHQIDSDGTVQDDETEKGILDGVMGSSSPSTTAKPAAGGFGGLPGLGSSVANAGPMLIIGGFQAVVTKFDPAMIAGLPGMGGLGNVFPKPSK